MGFAAGSARLFMLIARRSDIELQMTFIEQARLQLSGSISSVTMQQLNFEADSPQWKQFQALLIELQQRDKRLEIFANRLSKEHEAVMRMQESANKVLSKNIASFGIMA